MRCLSKADFAARHVESSHHSLKIETLNGRRNKKHTEALTQSQATTAGAYRCGIPHDRQWRIAPEGLEHRVHVAGLSNIWHKFEKPQKESIKQLRSSVSQLGLILLTSSVNLRLPLVLPGALPFALRRPVLSSRRLEVDPPSSFVQTELTKNYKTWQHVQCL